MASKTSIGVGFFFFLSVPSAAPFFMSVTEAPKKAAVNLNFAAIVPAAAAVAKPTVIQGLDAQARDKLIKVINGGGYTFNSHWEAFNKYQKDYSKTICDLHRFKSGIVLIFKFLKQIKGSFMEHNKMLRIGSVLLNWLLRETKTTQERF